MKKYLASFALCALVIIGTFGGSTIAANILIGLTILAVVLFILAHGGLEKTPSAWKTLSNMGKSKLPYIYLPVIFISLAGAGYWWLFFAWLAILLMSISIAERSKKLLEAQKEPETTP